RLHLDIRDRITGTDTALKEFLRVVGGRLFSALCGKSDGLSADVLCSKERFYFKGADGGKGIDLTFAFGDDADRHALNPARAKVILHAHLPPENRAELESYDPVEHTAGLLR